MTRNSLPGNFNQSADVLHSAVQRAAELSDELSTQEVGGRAEPNVFGVLHLVDRVDEIVQDTHGPIRMSPPLVELVEKDRDPFLRSGALPHQGGRQHWRSDPGLVELEIPQIAYNVARVGDDDCCTVGIRLYFVEIHRVEELSLAASRSAHEQEVSLRATPDQLQQSGLLLE